jgi:hypothetical protein
MSNKKDQLEALSEIRSLMERSSRFLTLNGLAGVFAGIFAIVGTVAAYLYLDMKITDSGYYFHVRNSEGELNKGFIIFFTSTAFIMLLCSIVAASWLAVQKAKKNNLPVWDKTASRMLVALLIPLITGGFICLLMAYYGLFWFIAPMTLIFYGLALVNASKYTLSDIEQLGIMEIIIGLISCFFIGYGLLFWALGFGILHIVYGIVMYYKYERSSGKAQ